MKDARKISTTYGSDLSRREILEGLARQGLRELSKIKSECRRFERSWELRMKNAECSEPVDQKRFSWLQI